MKPVEISALASVITIVMCTVWYIILIAQRKIKPVVGAWLVSTLSMTLSLITYWSSPKANVMGSALNLASTFTVFSILVAACLDLRRGNQKIEFNLFQKKCLYASAGITILWIVIKLSVEEVGQHPSMEKQILLMTPNVLTQVLMVISYSMTIKKVWSARENTESILAWWLVFVASVIAIYTAYLKQDPLAYLYAIRSTVMCGILIFALHRIGWRNKKSAELAYATHRARTI